jgi:hypothetical protein
MVQKELIQRLLDENIPRYVYCFDKEYPNEAYCLIKKNGKWQVYYSERGNKTGLKEFVNEQEACNYFYDDLIRVLKGMGLL